jgi:hypothetical protein
MKGIMKYEYLQLLSINDIYTLFEHKENILLCVWLKLNLIYTLHLFVH